jgi:C-1 hydroxylase
MSIDKNKAVIQRLFSEILDARRLDLVGEVVSEDYADHMAFPGQAPGTEGFRQRYAGFLAMSDDGLHEIEDMVAEGDWVTVRVRAHGTHTGQTDAMPLAPTGRHFSGTGIAMYRVINGHIVEHWNVVDMLATLQQLGALAGPAS